MSADDPTDPQRLLPHHEPDTGRVRTIVAEEVNGSLERIEKKTRTILYFAGLIFAAGTALITTDRWANSLAKRDELRNLNQKITVLSAKVDALTTAIGKWHADSPRRLE